MKTTVQTNTNKNWFLLQGLLFCLLGIVMIIFSEVIIDILRFVVAGTLFLVAISAVWAYVQQRKNGGKNEWYLIVGAVFAVALGICLITLQNLLPILLAVATGIWILLRSIQIIALAITMKSFGLIDWVWFILVGLLILLFAIILMIWPKPMLTTAIILMGVASLLIGVYYFFVYLRASNVKLPM